MTESGKVGSGTVLAERYELEDVIGRGGFGTIWRARQINMDREVAIKILPPRFMVVNDVVERFKREAMLASRLRHPNTITLHDYGQHDNLLYIVMEILTGEDLADVLKREGRLPADRIMHISRQVLKSLAEAHEQHIVHRDLKPENIFLSVVGDDRDHVKVLDFGIAKLAQPTAADTIDENQRRLTMSGSTVGTPTYMSPEQAAGEEVDGLTDLYALGVIMYEMACGRPPFYSKDPVKIMRAQLFEPVPPLRDESLHGTVLDRVIQKALAKDREQRFQSAHQMLLALAGEPVARPMIQGIASGVLSDANGLGEPSTQDIDLEEGSGPNTDDFEPNEEKKFPNTLAFAASVPRGDSRTEPAQSESEADNSDAVPFASLSDPEKRRKRETVRSNVTDRPRSTESGLTSDSELTGEVAQEREEKPSGSSILTVIDSDSSDDDVILLTQKKGHEEHDASDVAETGDEADAPENFTPPPAPASAKPEPSGDLSPASGDDDQIPFESAPEKPDLSLPADENSESWEWGRPDARAMEEGPPIAPRSSSGRWLLLIIAIVVVALIVLFATDLSGMLL